ncbi:MAG: dTDP-4-dehydrorhamnose 3,5-epimerase [Betaproteobacteria bacterium]|nr:dTDP-4-dehydrorhamnose 3,5-epimerase [Betaproteobacteria bacterium]
MLILEPEIFVDERGFFLKSYHERVFRHTAGIDARFVQDNHSRFVHNVLRSLHYQIQQPQGKLVRVVVGEIFDMAVDLRRSSATFGRWMGQRLSAENRRMLWIPAGFAHGFLALSEAAEVLYKTTDYYAPHHERCIAWNDAHLGISWPLAGAPIISDKDRRGVALQSAATFP